MSAYLAHGSQSIVVKALVADEGYIGRIVEQRIYADSLAVLFAQDLPDGVIHSVRSRRRGLQLISARLGHPVVDVRVIVRRYDVPGAAMGCQNPGFVGLDGADHFTGNGLLMAAQAGHGNGALPPWLAKVVVVAGEGELGHGVFAALPLGGALRNQVSEEDALPAAGADGRVDLLEIVGMLGDRIGTILALAAVQGVQLSTQYTSAQGPQGIALDAPVFG